MIRSFEELAVYQKAFEQAMRIFEITKHFRREQRYGFNDQTRMSRSARC